MIGLRKNVMRLARQAPGYARLPDRRACLVLVCLLLFGSAMAVKAEYARVPNDLPRDGVAGDWDEKTGLWFIEHPFLDHEPRHPIAGNAGYLARAAVAGTLSEVDADRVLANLRAAQQRDGHYRGNFWSIWANGKVTDPNAGFFTTLNLLILHHEGREQLSAESNALLDVMLAEAIHWFTAKVLPVTERKLRYPNAYLGDTACLWLLSEIQGSATDPLRAQVLDILAYYPRSPWGWGEHMSDQYTKICQRALLMMLMYGREMTPAMRVSVEQLLDELFAIDQQFAGGPRVPAIRNYHLERSPTIESPTSDLSKPYIQWMRPDRADDPVAQLAFRHGLHKRFAPKPAELAASARAVRVPCAKDTVALAWLDERWRLGAMSRYPIYDDTNHTTWGLHWQSLPVAFWHERGDWGYLQWVAREAGQTRALPALSRATRGSCILSDRESAAGVGQTWSAQHERSFLMLRRLPRVAATWPEVTDRFRLIHPTASNPRLDQIEGWHRLTLDYDGLVLTVAVLPLDGEPEVALTPRTEEGELHVASTWSWRTPDHRPSSLAALWFITMDTKPVAPPQITRQGDAWWRGADPLAKLTELSVAMRQPAHAP